MIQAYRPHYDQAASGAVHWSRTERRMEHRMHSRVEIAIPARLHFRDGAFISGLAVNISQGGIFIKSPMWAWRDGCVDVRMHVQGLRGDSILRIPSFIVHRSHGGMGLMFREIDAEAEALVDDLVHAEMATRRRTGQAPTRRRAPSLVYSSDPPA